MIKLNRFSMISSLIKNNSYRYERKFWVEGLSKQQLEQDIKTNSSNFREIFYERTVNNIYFDTSTYRNYRENISGNTNRTKVRIRWYEEIFGYQKNPVLEFKIKEGLMGTKLSYKLTGLKIQEGINTKEINKTFQKSSLPAQVVEYFSILNPVLLNSYKRRYFESYDKKFRCTVDSQLRFYEIKNDGNVFLNKAQLVQPIILEIKYELDNDQYLPAVTQQFPFRLTRSSKYVTGINLINNIGY